MKIRNESQEKLQNELNFAPLSTVEIEGSFSILHSVVDEKRTNLNDDTLEAMMIVKYNNNV